MISLSTRGAVASDGIAGKRIQEIFEEARRIRRQPIGRMGLGLCGNFPESFPHQPRLSRYRDGLTQPA
jgi:hypothetical protein